MNYLLLMVILIVVNLVRKMYKKHYKKLTKYKHFHERALVLDRQKKYGEAIETRKNALQLSNLSTIEQADALLGIGGSYLYQKDYHLATKYFDQAFEVAKNETFPYYSQYEKIIDAYVKAERRTDAVKVTESLLERQSYDKRFAQLQKILDQL